jgi:hypothetical protein
MPDRPHYGRHVAWLEREVRRLGVDVRLGVDADVAGVLECGPEVVIVATGAQTVVPPEAAGAAVQCATDIDLLEGRIRIEPGTRVVVYDQDGQTRGGGIAVLAAMAGAAVELVTPLLAACQELDPTQQPHMYRQLARHRVRCTPNQLLIGVRDGAVLLRDAWSDAERTLDDADLVIFTGYREARSGMGDALLDGHSGLEVRLVGDCLAPRRLHDAVAEGARAGNTV